MVNWTDGAQSDLKDIYNYIADDSLAKAKEITEKIFNKAQELEKQPYLGRIIPRFKDYSIREIFAYSYHISYQVKNSDVFILGIHHGRRNLEDINFYLE